MVYEYLRMVRLAGGWRSYVTGERRALATLMALWKRNQERERRGIADTPRSVSSGASGDAAVWVKVFDLPSHVAGRILCFYTDLVL